MARGVGFAPRPPYSQEKNPATHLTGGRINTVRDLNVLGKAVTSCPAKNRITNRLIIQSIA